MQIDAYAEFRAWALSVGLELTEAQFAAFAAFEAALYAQNETKNLTRVPRELAWRRHFADSLLFHDLIPFGAKVLDLGTGPGLPAWPLALARPDLAVTALDSNGKMLDFVISQPLPNLTPVLARAEDWGVREEFDVVTGRALAQLAIQLELSAPPCKVGGKVIPMRLAMDEKAARKVPMGLLSLRLVNMVSRTLQGEEAVRLFPIYHKSRPTPKRYPRRWAEIKAQPIDYKSKSSSSGPSQDL